MAKPKVNKGVQVDTTGLNAEQRALAEEQIKELNNPVYAIYRNMRFNNPNDFLLHHVSRNSPLANYGESRYDTITSITDEDSGNWINDRRAEAQGGLTKIILGTLRGIS